jgi:acyl carrier protein
MGWFSRRQPEKATAPTAAAPASSTTGVDATGQVLASLREYVSRLSDGKLAVGAIDAKGHIFDCGYVDSFKSAELLNFVEKQFGVSIPEVELVGALCTLESIARHVAGKRG